MALIESVIIRKQRGFIMGRTLYIIYTHFQLFSKSNVPPPPKNALLNERNKQASTLILSMRSAGAKWADIVNPLNDNGFRTRRECNFDITAVKRLYSRYEEINV